MFYLTWKSQLDHLSDKELRRFIYNLISWHQDEEIELKTKSDLLVWNGVLPVLKTNAEKWNSRAGTSRENGKLGGRPSKVLTQETQQVFEEPTEPVNSKELNVNSKMLNVNSEGVIVNGEKLNVNSEEVIVESKPSNSNLGESMGSFHKRRIKELTRELESQYPQYPFLVSMANPEEIKSLKYHIEDKDELDKITNILKELATSKKELWGRYD